MSMKKKRWLQRIVILVMLILFCWIQNKYLTVTYYIYETALLPENFEGFRIVQISDLHNATFGAGNGRLVSKVEALQPDMIVLTGDLVDSGHTNMKVALEFAKESVAIAPTYYITGNHENWLEVSEKEYLLTELEKLSVMCLRDEAVEISLGDSTFTLIGLNDESLMGNTLRMVLEDTDTETLRILLAHEPQYLDNYAASGVDLVLTGHAHGGQFRLPFVGGLVAPDQGLFPEYTNGEHVKGETTMIISRGLGNSVIPLRVFNLPEIVCVDLSVK
ncbi:MAG: metallophosphoesterase [Lachnospiraceae bacterium]|nr:metallophosphoesterase [Lachnospiraceae bacterium]